MDELDGLCVAFCALVVAIVRILLAGAAKVFFGIGHGLGAYPAVAALPVTIASSPRLHGDEKESDADAFRRRWAGRRAAADVARRAR